MKRCRLFALPLCLGLASVAACAKDTNGADLGSVELGGATDLATGVDQRGTNDLAASPPDLLALVDAASPDFAGNASVIEHHGAPSRAGHYLAPWLTQVAATGLHLDPNFKSTIAGPTYGQPLYIDGPTPVIITATEQNNVYALDAKTGATLWQKNLGAPVPLAKLPCGNIDPLGVTSTPIVDLATRTLYVAGMSTPDGGTTKQHKVYALSVDTGAIQPGWPVDVGATATSAGLTFSPATQHQRGALQVLGHRVYVPYGGHFGDCGDYHGWVVGIDRQDPTKVGAWATRARGGGAWSPSGLASDGSSLFVATGNTFGALTWSDGEAHIRLGPGPVFSMAAADYFSPSDWATLDSGDLDIGGTGPLLIEVPGATPSKLDVVLGKDTKAYLLDATNLGGVGKPLAAVQVATASIITAPATYRTALGTYVVFSGPGKGCPNGAGDFTALRIGATNPPTITVAWCASVHGFGSPIATTSDGTHDAIVWVVGAELDNRLHGLDGDTGKVVYAGGGMAEQLGKVRRFETPIVAAGRIFVGGDNAVYAFTL